MPPTSPVVFIAMTAAAVMGPQLQGISPPVRYVVERYGDNFAIAPRSTDQDRSPLSLGSTVQLDGRLLTSTPDIRGHSDAHH